MDILSYLQFAYTMLQYFKQLLFFSVFFSVGCNRISVDEEHKSIFDSKVLHDITTDTTEANAAIDSLNTILLNSSPDTLKIEVANNLAEEWITINPSNTHKIASQVLVLAKRLQNPLGIANAWNNLGLYYYYVDSYDSALTCYNNAVDISQGLWTRLPRGKAYYGMGNIYRFTGYPDKAMEYFNLAIGLYQDILLSEPNAKEAKRGLAATYDKIGNIFTSKGDYQEALNYTFKSLEINREIGDKRLESYSLHSIAIGYYYLGENQKALGYNLQSLNLREQVGDKVGAASSLQNIGLIYSVLGDIVTALDYFHESLRIKEEIGDKRGAGYSYFHIGTIYKDQGDYQKALHYYRQAMKIRIETGDRNGVAYLLNHEGEVYTLMAEKFSGIHSMKDSVQLLAQRAIGCFQKSEEMFESTSDRFGLANSYLSLGRTYRFLNDNEKSLKYFSLSKGLYETIGNKRGLAEALYSIALISFQQGSDEKAFDLARESYRLSKELGSPDKIYEAAALLNEIYRHKKNFALALKFFEESIVMRDSIRNTENQQLADRRHWEIQYAKKSLADSLQHKQRIMVKDLELSKKIEESKKQRVAIYALAFVFISMIVIAVFIYRSYLIKIGANKIISEKNTMLEQAYEEIKATSEVLANKNELLQEQNEEIRIKSDEIESQRNSLANLAWELQDKSEEIERQKNLLTVQNKEITDSIVYARRIQSAVLPSNQYLSQLFPDFFILYKPKSIVSGDFYWATKVNQWLIFCVTDCTGHGVPGAFMSMLGVSFLNEIVRKEAITNAAQVLNELRNHVIASMVERDGELVMFDGMDIGLCVIDTQSLSLQFAGANIPCWIHSPNGQEAIPSERIEKSNGLFELKPDRMPIARFERMLPFTQVEFKLQKDDLILISSDGFADQFGGPLGKKFQKYRLMELLSLNTSLPLSEQKELYSRIFEEWMGDRSQIDDVTILGVRI